MEYSTYQEAKNQAVAPALLPLTLTRTIIDILQNYFFLDIIEDQKRIKVTVEIISRLIEVPDWKQEIEKQHKGMRRLFEEKKSLLQIAIELHIPVDELEKFCRTTSDISFQIGLEDRDLQMYAKVRCGLKKREARRAAYEHLKALGELQNSLWAIRMILGASKKHFEELQEVAGRHGKIQPGVAAIKPSSQVKHELNRILCQELLKAKKRSLAIFEPTQGVGEATHLYAQYGFVVSVERGREPHTHALASHKHHCADLSVHLTEGWTIEELIKRTEQEKDFRVLMPLHARNVYKVIPELRQMHWHFDIIDVDPFDQFDVYKMVEEVFPLLSDISMLFVSVNPSPRYGRSKEIAQLHGEPDTPAFREQLWRFDCWRHMWRAYDYDLALIPIVVHKCWTMVEQSGIDRLYFIAVKTTREQRNAITYEYLGSKALKEQKTSPIRSYQSDTIPVLYFGSDIDEEKPKNIPHIEILIRRIREILQTFHI